MAAAFWIPQRVPQRSDTLLANEIVSRLEATLAELKQQELVTAAEEERLDEEIERIRRSAERRVDASSWEASTRCATRSPPVSPRSRTRLKWAEESLARYAPRAGRRRRSRGCGAGGGTDEGARAAGAARSAAGAPEDLQRLIKGGKLPTDAASLRALMSSLGQATRGSERPHRRAPQLGKGSGRFDPAEFPSRRRGVAGWRWHAGTEAASIAAAPTRSSRGARNRRRSKVQGAGAPAGRRRSPDDWAPVVELPGAPDAAPVLSAPSAARQYAAVAGQSAWRRTLAPRHQSAVKKYFEK